MNHCSENFNYEVEIDQSGFFDKDWIIHTNKEKLIQYCHSFFKSGKTLENYDSFVEKRILCMKHHNVVAFEIFAQSIGAHDRDSVNYSYCLEDAVEYSNLQMVQHCLYKFMNETCNDGNDLIHLDTLLTLTKDVEIINYLEKLRPILVNGYLEPGLGEDNINLIKSDLYSRECDEYDTKFFTSMIQRYELYTSILNN